MSKCKVGSQTLLSSSRVVSLDLFTSCGDSWWPTFTQGKAGESLGVGGHHQRRLEHQASDFFSCTCFALNVMESKTLQKFSPKILGADLKVCKILLCVSLCLVSFFFFSAILKLGPAGDIPLSC